MSRPQNKARTFPGALTCFLITVANLSVAGVSAPFWGILIGCAVAYVMDRE
ncbi:benzoate/H(+) symporter BenE family transporter [Corynebacterium renale]|uniref:benzoate/H(+) symporter BenE family transporter n=1 Tax=Corynebacterium renale TaxID=1724 RepID=UPI000DBE7615|nr:benzoate/H(+) symporter BenE family transporter [Corynebacterium renale]